ncbi:MAG: hypothetical protein J7K83_00645 [Candidatus Aenigmarchaeota archaeon]|nr:hypothetical protein [Candidatus Aenigmarchaeota archaeon]
MTMNEYPNLIMLLPEKARQAFRTGSAFLAPSIKLVAIFWKKDDVEAYFKDLERLTKFYREAVTIAVDLDVLKEEILNTKNRAGVMIKYFALISGAFGGFVTEAREIITKYDQKYFFVYSYTHEYAKGKTDEEIFAEIFKEFQDFIKKFDQQKGGNK